MVPHADGRATEALLAVLALVVACLAWLDRVGRKKPLEQIVFDRYGAFVVVNAGRSRGHDISEAFEFGGGGGVGHCSGGRPVGLSVAGLARVEILVILSSNNRDIRTNIGSKSIYFVFNVLI